MIALSLEKELGALAPGRVKVGDRVVPYGEAVLLSALAEAAHFFVCVEWSGGADKAQEAFDVPTWQDLAAQCVAGDWLSMLFAHTGEGIQLFGTTVTTLPDEVPCLGRGLTATVGLQYIRDELAALGIVAPAAEPEDPA